MGLFSRKGKARAGQFQDAVVLSLEQSGFTVVERYVAPDQVVALVRGFLELSLDVLSPAASAVELFGSTGVKALFTGNELATLCQMAGQSALALAEQLATFRGDVFGETGCPFTLAVASGAAVAAPFRRGEIERTLLLGGAVALAERLQQTGRLLGAAVAVCDEVKKHIAAPLKTRELDLIAVRGRREPMLIHELINRSSAVTDDDLIARSGAAISAYRQQQWEASVQQFMALLVDLKSRTGRSDRLSLDYVERCRFYAATPPGKDWNGVWAATMPTPPAGPR
jgi:adenylate cyclase